MSTPYKLKLLNGILKLKTMAEYTISLLGIKDLGTQSGEVTNGLIDWSIQHFTKTTAEWNADTTTILLKGQIGVEDTGNTAFKIKIGNGVDLWADLSYLSGGASSSVWGAITGTLSNQTDLQNALNAKENSITSGTTSQYWRGDKTWQTLDKTAVGLGNVDNTSDTNKPISTATQTALDGKVDENAPITGATKTKITYDSKGLVTSGADATTSDIAEGSNLYFTNARALSAAPAETVNTIGTLVNGAAAAVPNDTDLFSVTDTSVLKKLSGTNLKAYLKTYFDTLYATQSIIIRFAATSPADSTTTYFGSLEAALNATASTRQFGFNKAGTITDFIFNLFQSVNGSGETVTIKLYNVTDATDVGTIGTFTSNFGANTLYAISFNSLSLSVLTTKMYAIKIETPAFLTNPTLWQGSGHLYLII